VKRQNPGSREKLLRSAEALFASKGYREVSVREIASHAGVNSALVAYYFRSKQQLFNQVYRMHTIPLARERMKMLSAAMRNGNRPSLEEILKAWIFPWLQPGLNPKERALQLRLTANLSVERWERLKKGSPYLQRTHHAFLKALRSRLPHLSNETLMWRLHFIVGAIAFGVRAPNSLLGLSRGKCDPRDLEATFVQILPYAAAGFRAREAYKR
jgi:AcrR family transcriptional regulator